MTQNIDNSMVHIMNESVGDFQQGGWLPVQVDQWHSMDTQALDKLQKHASEKADQSTLGSGAVVNS